MSTRTTESATLLWVCVDCYETHHGIREDHHGAPDREPLQLVEASEVASGMLWSEHSVDCVNAAAEQWLTDCDCEHVTFSWTPCDGCGSTLGGSREALTVWH